MHLYQGRIKHAENCISVVTGQRMPERVLLITVKKSLKQKITLILLSVNGYPIRSENTLERISTRC